jgi:phosphate uptake regulator
MEFRKLITFGKGSYILSLPKDWVRNNKLKKGASLSVEAFSNSLIISTSLAEEAAEKRTISINADNKDIEEIRTEIVTSYLTGFDLIEIVAKKIKDNDEKIKEIIMNLAGLEILEQTSTKITAKYLLNTKEVSLDSLIRRMDNITRSLIIDSQECINGACNYASIKQRDNDVNRLNFLILRSVREIISSSRQLNLVGKTVWELITVLGVAERIEKIADRQKRIARGIEQLKLSKRFADELKIIYEKLNVAYIDSMKAFYQNDKKLARSIELTSKERAVSCDKLLSMGIKKEYQLLYKKNHEMENYVNEHMIMAEIINNLKAMTASVKMIARTVMNNDLDGANRT